MMNERRTDRFRGRLLLVSRCSYSRLALHGLLYPARVTVVPSLASGICCDKTAAGGASGLVLHLSGGFREVMSVLVELTTWLAARPASYPVVLVTEMSRSCAQAMLMLAGLPADRERSIRLVRGRSHPVLVARALQGALNPDSRICALPCQAGRLCTSELRALRGLWLGIPVIRLARMWGLSTKTVYSQMHTALSRMRVASRNALLCGDFRDLREGRKERRQQVR